MKQMKNLNTQRGVTLIELSFVLAIFGLLIAGALAGAAYFDGAKANNEASALLRVFSNLQQKYATAAKTTAVTTANAITGNVFNDPAWSVDKVAGTVTNQFSGSVTVTKATAITTDDAFLITETEVPSSVCQKLIPLVMDSTYALKIGTVTIKANPTIRPAPATIDTECAKTATATIAYTIHKNRR